MKIYFKSVPFEGVIFYFLLGMTLLLLGPGLSGPFILDDMSNLKSLGSVGGVKDWNSFIRFILGGFSGPSGRPLSLLSFIMNDTGWPSDPWIFKYTNLFLHLLNGSLIFWLILLVSRAIRLPEKKAAFIGLSVTGLWLWHPLNISSVLYVVQRMNQLSTLFTLAGLILYVSGRRILWCHPLQGYIRMSLGIGFCTILAVLSKENGILLPGFAVVIEIFLLRHSLFANQPPYWRLWSSIFLYLPLFIIVSYFIFNWANLMEGYEARDFGLGERLLTQGRVITDYILQIVVPSISSMGLFQDDYPFSRGILDPPSTLAALVGLGGIGGMAIIMRRRHPMFSFGIFWFFTGHLLESTFLPLELYFEHRNYLPMVGLLWAFCHWAWTEPNRTKELLIRPTLAAYSLMLAIMCWQNAQLWGSAPLLAEAWSLENPASVRAQQNAANHWSTAGRPELARKKLEGALIYHPDDLGLRLEILQMNCLTKTVTQKDKEQLLLWLPKGQHYSNAAVPTLLKIIDMMEKNNCPGLLPTDIEQFVTGLLHNPYFLKNDTAVSNILSAQGRHHAINGRIDEALHSYDLASQRLPENIDLLLIESDLLLFVNRFKEAVVYLEKARSLDENAGIRRYLRKRDIDMMEKKIVNKLQKEMKNMMPSGQKKNQRPNPGG
ncbi:MAG: hypothetical protein H7832_12240 [Magnetococcus sp. DMHC-6]